MFKKFQVMSFASAFILSITGRRFGKVAGLSIRCISIKFAKNLVWGIHRIAPSWVVSCKHVNATVIIVGVRPC